MAASVALLSVALLSLSCSYTAVTAAPTPLSIGSDLAVLAHNDLYGNASSNPASTIVLRSRLPHRDSAARCEALRESLWSPGDSSSQQQLRFLRYLDHGKWTDDVGVYWITTTAANKSASASECSAISTYGEIQSHSCDTHLPALCSNSAPLSSQLSADTNPKWHVAVTTANATVTGYRDKHSFRFLGLKYATIPARFEHSKYAPPAAGTNTSALEYAPRCMQVGCDGGPSCSEDCLSLNIWTPYLPVNKAQATKKAVLVWIHGGGFTSGTASDPTFDGGAMASRGDVVVVTVNYRLSTLGFLAISNTPLKGNYGLVDQNMALDWIRTHIEDFGGDKDRITVFGQSAGAASVRALLASPQAKGKFAGAITMSTPQGSNYASTFARYLTIEEATAQTKSLLNETNCTQPDGQQQLACLRNIDPLVLVGRRKENTWGGTIARFPVVDGTYLTSKELPLDESAPKLNITLLTGIMRNDGSPFSAYSTSHSTSEALTEQGFDAETILSSDTFKSHQHDNQTNSIFNLTSRVATDAMFRCLGQSTAAVAATNKILPVVYSYEFDRAYQISEWSPNPPSCEAPITEARPYGDTSQPYYRCHSGELYYVFGTLVRQGRPPRDADDIPFSQYIVDTWTAFARTLNPNVDIEFLRARDFSNTLEKVKSGDKWEPVREGRLRLSALDVGGVVDEGFRETEGCEVLGFPVDYYGRGRE